MPLITIQRSDNVGLSRTTINDNFTYLDSLIQELASGLHWQEAVLDITTEGAATQTLGYRYIASATGGGWTINNIYEWNGASWTEFIVTEDDTAFVVTLSAAYTFNGTNWVLLMPSIIAHNSLSGLQGGTTGEYYHLTQSDQNILTSNADAQALHYHDLQVAPPLTPTSTGVRGQWAVKDAETLGAKYLFFCIATNTWVRYITETSWT